jgi:hypothetical protein
MLSPYKGALYRAKANPVLVEHVETDTLHGMDFWEALAFYKAIAPFMTDADIAYLAAVDRFYLFTHVLNRVDGLKPWLYDRCREVEMEPDGFLDLWAREHYKSSLITFAGIIQEIVTDPEVTIGVFSHTKGISKKFVSQIKNEIEQNDTLRRVYPDIFWINPRSEAPNWSDYELTVRRSSNPKECTVEAHGLVDGQPTSKHFKILVYDDVVTIENVTNPEQVKKTTEAWELSDNLGSGDRRKWMIGTRYAFGDTYGDLIQRGVVETRIYAATDTGRLDGKPVFLSEKRWTEVKRTQRSTVAAQMLQNPLSGKEVTFRPEWFTGYEVRPTTMNVYIMGDPSRGKKAKNDSTAIVVVGVDAQGNKFLLDGFCHRMKLSERWDHLKHLHKKWSAQPGVGYVKVGWERYGQQSDDEYFQERMLNEKYHFAIAELAWPNEGEGSKKARVERLQPDFEYGAFLVPRLVQLPGQGACLWSVDDTQMRYEKSRGDSAARRKIKERGQEYLLVGPLAKKDSEGQQYDLTRVLMDQMLFFPFAAHDDLVDALSRVYDMEVVPATVVEPEDELTEMPPDV